MQYALMIYPSPDQAEIVPPEEYEALRAEYLALTADPHFVAGAQLQAPETATTVRVENSKTLVTDGPFADTKEVLGGVTIIEANDLDEAIELAARVPAARLGGGVEIRPLVPR